jgi:hypothetical protein
VRAKILHRCHTAVRAFEEGHFFVADGAAQGLVAQGFEFGLSAGHVPGVSDEHASTFMANE